MINANSTMMRYSITVHMIVASIQDSPYLWNLFSHQSHNMPLAMWFDFGCPYLVDSVLTVIICCYMCRPRKSNITAIHVVFAGIRIVFVLLGPLTWLFWACLHK